MRSLKISGKSVCLSPQMNPELSEKTGNEKQYDNVLRVHFCTGSKGGSVVM